MTPSVLRYLAQRGAALPTRRGDDEPFEVLAFALGTQHPMYRVTGDSMRPFREYAFYIRVPDLPAFIRRIAPVLEQRLADSVATGYSGELQLSFYRDGLVMHFETVDWSMSALSIHRRISTPARRSPTCRFSSSSSAGARGPRSKAATQTASPTVTRPASCWMRSSPNSRPRYGLLAS